MKWVETTPIERLDWWELFYCNKLFYFSKLILFIVLLLTVSISNAEAYKWVDENGNIHFGDKPPDVTSAESVKIRKKSSTSGENTPLHKDENLMNVKDSCNKFIVEQQSPKVLQTHDILGKWQFYAQSKCLDEKIQPSNAFKYNWEFKTATTVEMSLGRTRSSASYKLKNNVIYLDNLSKTTMVLIRREPQRLVWAHLLGNSFEGYFYVKRN